MQIDAGADLIVTQLFYDVELFIQFEKDCRSVGITCPIIPGSIAFHTVLRLAAEQFWKHSPVKHPLDLTAPAGCRHHAHHDVWGLQAHDRLLQDPGGPPSYALNPRAAISASVLSPQAQEWYDLMNFKELMHQPGLRRICRDHLAKASACCRQACQGYIL